MKKPRIKIALLILVFLLCQMYVAPVHATSAQCDEALFFAAQITAFHDPTPPPFNFESMHWQLSEDNYQVDYWWKSGFGGFVQTVNVRQGKRVVGVATNGAWSVCHSSKAWRNYLLGHLP